MRNAYALLGVSFLVVFLGAYILIKKDTSPTEELTQVTISESMLTLTSPEFEYNADIPSRFTCDGPNISPELSISGVPEGTKSLVLVMDDPDIPKEVQEGRGIEKFDHWVLYNIDPRTTVIPEGEVLGSTGKNSVGEESYRGPCPPPEYEPTRHRYVFRLYALSGTLNFIATPTLEEVEVAAKGSVLESAELIGLYERVQ